MSVAAISSGLQTYQNTTLRSNLQQFQQEFQQLGSDLQSGNLSGAQSDLKALQQSVPSFPGSSLGSNTGSNPISQAFSQLSQQLQSGNLTGAQQDYSNLKQNFDERGADYRHHHAANGTPSTPVSNPLLQLGTSSEASSQASALQAYGTVQASELPFADPSQTSQSGSNGISLVA